MADRSTDTTPIPLQFDHEPVPPMKVEWVGYWGLIWKCGWSGWAGWLPKPRGWGCANRRERTVIIPRVGTKLPGLGVVTQFSVDNLIRHERAHLNGWPDDHSDPGPQ